MVLEPPPVGELRRLYHVDGLYQREIADQYGVSLSTVSRWLDHYDLREKPHQNPDKLHEMYLERGMTTYEIGDRFGVSNVTIGNQLERHGIERRSNSESHMATHPPVYISTSGYLTARSTLRGEINDVHIHDLVAIANGADPYKIFSGVQVADSTVVHHKNGFKSDNRPGNLASMTASEHMSHHNLELDRTHSRKLTIGQAEEIRERYANNDITQGELGEEYGVTQTCVSNIISGHTYNKK